MLGYNPSRSPALRQPAARVQPGGRPPQSASGASAPTATTAPGCTAEASATRTISARSSSVNTGEKFSFQEKLPGYTDFVPDLQPADCDAKTRALADICLVLLNSNEFAYLY